MRKRLVFNTLNFIQKIKIGGAPEYLTEELKYVEKAQPYRLRNVKDFRIQRAATSAMQKSLYYKELNMENKII